MNVPWKKVVDIFKRVQVGVECDPTYGCLIFKSKQIQCYEEVLNGNDVFAVLPTGFGKSIIYHLLPYIFPAKDQNNIVIVIAPLDSIIQDQISVLSSKGIPCECLKVRLKNTNHEKLMVLLYYCFNIYT